MLRLTEAQFGVIGGGGAAGGHTLLFMRSTRGEAEPVRAAEQARALRAEHERLRRESERLAAEHGISIEDAITVGDGANDLEMLAAAGTGVAFRAKPLVAEAARFRIDFGDLRALLYIQGYTNQQIREGSYRPAR